MKNCALCYHEFTKQCNSHSTLFEVCRLYLHSSLTQETSKTASEDWNLPFCSKCLESAMELDKLSKQLQSIQKGVSEFTFKFGLEILHRRGKVDLSKTDENAEQYSRQESAEFDVSTFSKGNGCSQRISNCAEALLFDSMTQEAISVIVDKIDPLVIPVLTEEVSTSEITFEKIKIENSEQSSIASLNNGTSFEDTGSESIIIIPTSTNSKPPESSLSTHMQCGNLIPTVKLIRLSSKPNKYGKTGGQDLIIPAATKSPPITSPSSSSMFASSPTSTPLNRKEKFSYHVDKELREQLDESVGLTGTLPHSSPPRPSTSASIRCPSPPATISTPKRPTDLVKPFRCDHCKKAYETKEGLRAHRKNTHNLDGGPRKETCPICGQIFLAKSMGRHKIRCKEKIVGDEIDDDDEELTATSEMPLLKRQRKD